MTFTAAQIAKIKSSGGHYDPATGTATDIDGSPITSSSGLDNIDTPTLHMAGTYAAGLVANQGLQPASFYGGTDAWTPEATAQAMKDTGSTTAEIDTVYANSADTANATDTAINWGKDGLGGTLLGAGQLGLGVASYFEGKKTAKLQRENLKGQIAYNADALDRSKRHFDSISAALKDGVRA